MSNDERLEQIKILVSGQVSDMGTKNYPPSSVQEPPSIDLAAF